jgi:hypothetical protein
MRIKQKIIKVLNINKLRKYKIIKSFLEKIYEYEVIKPISFDKIIHKKEYRLKYALANGGNQRRDKLLELNTKVSEKGSYKKFKNGDLYFKFVEPFSIIVDKMGLKLTPNHSCDIILKYLKDNDSYILNKNQYEINFRRSGCLKVPSKIQAKFVIIANQVDNVNIIREMNRNFSKDSIFITNSIVDILNVESSNIRRVLFVSNQSLDEEFIEECIIKLEKTKNHKIVGCSVEVDQEQKIIRLGYRVFKESLVTPIWKYREFNSKILQVDLPNPEALIIDWGIILKYIEICGDRDSQSLSIKNIILFSINLQIPIMVDLDWIVKLNKKVPLELESLSKKIETSFFETQSSTNILEYFGTIHSWRGFNIKINSSCKIFYDFDKKNENQIDKSIQKALTQELEKSNIFIISSDEWNELQKMKTVLNDIYIDQKIDDEEFILNNEHIDGTILFEKSEIYTEDKYTAETIQNALFIYINGKCLCDNSICQNLIIDFTSSSNSFLKKYRHYYADFLEAKCDKNWNNGDMNIGKVLLTINQIGRHLPYRELYDIE